LAAFHATPLPYAPGCNPGGIAFVIVHYRLPELRLREFLTWNADGIARLRARLVIVADRDYADLPPWARVAHYPHEMPVFNLAKAANYGIRHAGSGIVCKTDPDCLFPPEALEDVARASPLCGVCLTYRMADSASPDDIEKAAIWTESKGTVALYADHWASLCGYDERMVGYGMEDSDLVQRAQACRDRTVYMSPAPVYHVAHSSAPQPAAPNRTDCYNRANFNPCNHDHNRRIMSGPGWSDPMWGFKA
jgi:hypothetical protein